MVAESNRQAAETMVTEEPVRESTDENLKAAVRNSGSGLREWISEEAAWLLAQFLKLALSVAVFRGVHQLFRAGFASESVYRRAPDLWSHGHQERGYRFGNGGQTGGYSPSWQRSQQSAGNGSAGSGQRTPENPRYVTTVGGYHIYLHRTLLDPSKQYWPCPLLYRTPCDGCFFQEFDRAGNQHCAAVEKLRSVLNGTDGGEDLSEIREWIRSS